MSIGISIERAKSMLAAGEVSLIVGYAIGSTNDRRRPMLATNVDDAAKLVVDAACVDNLAMYTTRVGEAKRVGIFLRSSGVRAMNVLAAESQIDPTRFVIFAFDVDASGNVSAMEGSSLEEFRDRLTRDVVDAETSATIAKFQAMTSAERFAFWRQQFSKCIKCYACRQACPMCSCRRCIVEANQPQWICPSATTLGNTEWNIVRAFHLAGRCVECGNCSRACPVGIPLHLLNTMLAEVVEDEFETIVGRSSDQPAVMASFKNDDPQTFIK